MPGMVNLVLLGIRSLNKFNLSCSNGLYLRDFARSFDSSVFRFGMDYGMSWLRGEAWQSDLSFQPARETWGHAS